MEEVNLQVVLVELLPYLAQAIRVLVQEEEVVAVLVNLQEVVLPLEVLAAHIVLEIFQGYIIYCYLLVEEAEIQPLQELLLLLVTLP